VIELDRGSDRLLCLLESNEVTVDVVEFISYGPIEGSILGKVIVVRVICTAVCACDDVKDVLVWRERERERERDREREREKGREKE
jgi:hypothetical protein